MSFSCSGDFLVKGGIPLKDDRRISILEKLSYIDYSKERFHSGIKSIKKFFFF